MTKVTIVFDGGKILESNDTRDIEDVRMFYTRAMERSPWMLFDKTLVNFANVLVVDFEEVPDVSEPTDE